VACLSRCCGDGRARGRSGQEDALDGADERVEVAAVAGAPAPPLDDAELARTVQLAPRFGLELRVGEALVA
jgi:hypothetical protein